MKLLLSVVLLVLVLVQWELSTVSGGVSISCREEERLALLRINASLSTFPIDSLDGKWEGKDCCRWERVTCNPITGHVTQLDLGVSFDYDELFIFDDLGMLLNTSMFLPLRHLRSLSLSAHGIYNCTDGAGFESWSNLTKLQMLDLSHNHLPKSIISSLAKVSSLRALYLDHNYMGDHVLVQELISGLNLEVVSLSGCDLFDSWSFLDLGHWSSLKALSLADNYLNDTLILEGLCRLKNLEELDLSGNSFTGNLSPCMGDLSSLKLIDFSNNQFQIKFPSSIFERLVSLRYLSLSYNQLEGTLSMRSFLNHSNLKVIMLSTLESSSFRVEVVNLSFQLQVLQLANCILDVEPTFLYSQHKLQVLDLSNTRSKGPLSFVLWLVENNTNLIKLDFQKNFLTGPLQLPFLTHEKLSILDISDNYLGGELPSNITTKLPNLLYLDLSENNFHGPIPLISPSNLQTLYLYSNNLSDEIQNSFSRIQPSFLSLLDLSYNNFYGSFTKNFNITRATSVLLNDNNISGEIPVSICNTSFKVMDLSNNELNGILPDCLGSATDRSVLHSELKLSGNHLEGSLPLKICEGFWFLDFSDNKFSGSIPPCHNMSNIKILNLSQNNLTGNFPITWLNISDMVMINIGKNHLSGKLSIWNGMASNLNTLLARENMFEGPIPKQICQIGYLRLLDLSYNNLSGQIPSCIIDMGSIVDYNHLLLLPSLDARPIRAPKLNFSDIHFLLHVQYYLGWYPLIARGVGFDLISKGMLNFYGHPYLEMQCVIDMSSNRLVGNIPEDIGRMNWLITLNLSNNHLSGSIPNSISNLYQLEILDLAHNSLTGEIPRELIKLNFLTSFSVAYNDLSGPTLGVEAQFGTFDNSSYEGNPNLCGFPLSKSCGPSLGTTQPSPNEMRDEQRNDGTDFVILFGSFSLFFVINFWCSIVVLYFKKNWRYALFTLADRYGDMIYVKVVLLTRKIRATLTRRG